METEQASTDKRQSLVFVAGNPGFRAVLLAAVVLALLVGFVVKGSNEPFGRETAITILVLLFFVFILFAALSRQWIAEIDMAARRLKISRRYFGRWTKTTVDCPLDECTVLGTIEYNTEGYRSYGVYMKSKQGKLHGIPLRNSKFDEAARVASQLSAATGIPRLDTTYP